MLSRVYKYVKIWKNKSLSQTLISNPYIFATQCRWILTYFLTNSCSSQYRVMRTQCRWMRPWIFQTMNYTLNNIRFEILLFYYFYDWVCQKNRCNKRRITWSIVFYSEVVLMSEISAVPWSSFYEWNLCSPMV